jgi:hypothetical protein
MPKGLDRDVYQMCYIANDPDALKDRNSSLFDQRKDLD